ncbi:probable lipid droplet phospholipase 1 at N-terminal half [Coccomyxa sp. Obi]|nr:probable lipid droplet phospholipase 1 at N-terminal half [Coccomyxa sp. Obi]
MSREGEHITEEVESRSPRIVKTHLALFVNGLNGNDNNWSVVIANLRKHAAIDNVAILASTANMSLKTYQGIDRCGQRLAEEVAEYVAVHPDLERISLIGHSMGGLIGRYALGKLYDPETELICGLRPTHFVTFATPHLGCDGDRSAAQVPFISWTGDIPLAGRFAERALAAAARPFSSVVMGKSGTQFFLQDAKEGRAPLLERMTQDDPNDGYYLSALKSFVTRTCYANSSGDWLVGWANSSLRKPEELPRLNSTKGRGVVSEQPLEAALHPSDRLPLSPTSSTAKAEFPGRSLSARNSRGTADWMVADPLEGRSFSTSLARTSSVGSLVMVDAEDGGGCAGNGAFPVQVRAAPERRLAAPAAAAAAQEQVGAADAALEESQRTLQMLARLQELPWRRIDVCFKGTSMPFFAHNLIQVTRKWLNWEGEAVAQHFAALFTEMETDPRVQRALR